MNRYFIGILVSIGLLVLLVVLLFSGNKPSSRGAVPKSLSSYANTDALVRMTIDGPITAGQDHNSVQITVGQNSATLNLIQGYDNNVIESKTYPNTQNGYSAFLYSLYYAGYSLGNNAENLKNDLGYCSIGNRYIFELIQNGNDLTRYWTTNCGGVKKTYNGDSNLTIDLFKAQIPDYYSLTRTATLSN